MRSLVDSGTTDQFGHVRLGGVGEPWAARSRRGRVRDPRHHARPRPARRVADGPRPRARDALRAHRRRHGLRRVVGQMAALRGDTIVRRPARRRRGRAEDGARRALRAGQRLLRIDFARRGTSDDDRHRCALGACDAALRLPDRRAPRGADRRPPSGRSRAKARRAPPRRARPARARHEQGRRGRALTAGEAGRPARSSTLASQPVLASLPIGELLEEVVRLAYEVGRVTAWVSQTTVHWPGYCGRGSRTAAESPRLGLGRHRPRHGLAGRVRVVDDVPLSGQIGSRPSSSS